MAAANKKTSAIAAPIPECPVCLDPMTSPIFQCKTGHSLCNKCTSMLSPPQCPICRQDMTQMRNWQLEELVGKAKVPCPNKSGGCVYMMVQSEIDDHLKECIFRTMDCPLGMVFGKCSWNGELKNMMDHFKERHPNNCNVSSDEEVLLSNVNVKEDERVIYLVGQGKLLYIITFKLDTLQNMAYWTIQNIGSKKSAQQQTYEIHVISRMDNRRKVVFTDHCFNDAVKADEVFRLGKCAMIPLGSLQNFIKDKKLGFRFFIKKSSAAPKNKNDNNKPGGGGKPDDNNKPGGGGKPDNNNKPGGGGKPDNNNKPGPGKGPKPKGPGPGKQNGQGPAKGNVPNFVKG